jgi:transposase, IS30 family
MKYQQLSLEERYQIQAGLRLRQSQAAIARQLGRHPSTISREIARNSDPRATVPYSPKGAARRAHKRRVVKGEQQRKIQGALRELVEQKLRLSWSPEQISGRLALEMGIRISHETIYQHVLRDCQKHGFLRYCLRFGGYKQHRFKKSKVGARTRERKNWIDQRPRAANERLQLGHWERDSLLGARGSSVVLTMVDRKSRYAQLRHVAKHDSEHVADATASVLRRHRSISKTLTNDNGSEFARDPELQSRIDIPIYFCEPGSPWQRGSVENLNGLIRQYLPKGADLDFLPPGWLAAVEKTLNHRPRKTLGYRTPHEVFYKQTAILTCGELMRFGLEFSAPI